MLTGIDAILLITESAKAICSLEYPAIARFCLNCCLFILASHEVIDSFMVNMIHHALLGRTTISSTFQS